MASRQQILYPLPSTATLRSHYVGQSIGDIPTPAAVLDRAIVERHCTQMLATCQKLGFQFRPHVKTHKTTEITRLQVGRETSDVNVIVSTVIEAEMLVDYLLDCKSEGKKVNVLYGVPLPPSQVERLVQVGSRLGSGSISVLIDHPKQLDSLGVFDEKAGFAPYLYLKIDTGYHRAGLLTNSNAYSSLVAAVVVFEALGYGHLRGFYSHAGHSYGVDSSNAAMDILEQELSGLEEAAKIATLSRPKTHLDAMMEQPKFVLSIGATPSVSSVKYLGQDSRQAESQKLQRTIRRVQSIHKIELHAGVYPILDMQQLATRAAYTSLREPVLHSSLALTILAEVISTYEERTPPEALIAAGSLSLGREPCKSYSGWGVVSDWGIDSVESKTPSAWQVSRISQEHGILGLSRVQEAQSLEIGQKVKIWPNHACIAGAGFGWYFVVDSRLNPVGRGDEIVDVWVRWRGW